MRTVDAADHHDHAPRHDPDGGGLVAGLEEREHDGAGVGAEADVDVEEDDAADQERPDDADGDPVAALEGAERRRGRRRRRCAAGRCAAGRCAGRRLTARGAATRCATALDRAAGPCCAAAARRPAGASRAASVRAPARRDDERAGVVPAQQAPAAEEEVGDEDDHEVGHHVVQVGRHLVAAEADLVHHAVDDDAGRGDGGERAGVRAVPDHDRHQERGDADLTRHRHPHRRHQRGGRDVAGADRRQHEREQEEHHRHDADVAAAEQDRLVGDQVERAVRLRLREEQRHPGQRQEQPRREAAHDLRGAHVGDVHADDPGQRDGQKADVQPDRATDDDGDRQRAEREGGGVHGPAV